MKTDIKTQMNAEKADDVLADLEAKRRFAGAHGSTATDCNKTVELKALIEADEKLEAAQDYLRGATRVKEIRAAIRERIKQLEAKP